MFGFLKKNRSLHPLADDKGAKTFFSELPVKDPYRTLKELAFWLEATRDSEGLKPQRVFEIVEALDNAASPHLRKLELEYGGGARLQQFQEVRIFDTVTEFWRQLGAAYEHCLALAPPGFGKGGALKHQLPVIIGRALRAFGTEIRWTLVRYRPVDPAVWGRLGSIYAAGEKRCNVNEAIPLYSASESVATVQSEYLKPLILAMSAPDALLSPELEVANRVIALLSDQFVMHSQPTEGCNFVVDMLHESAPMRLVEPSQQKPGLRFFGGGSAVDDLEKLINRISGNGIVPSSISLRGQFEAGLVVAVLRHLALYWSSTPPSRRHERRRSVERIHVVHGFNTIIDTVAERGDDLDFRSKVETWTVDNESDGGYGALIPSLVSDWLRIGSLLGIKQADDNGWGVGIVRRLSTTEDAQRYVGIEFMAKGVSHVKLFNPGQDTTSAGPASGANDAVLLPSDAEDSAGSGDITLLMRPGSFSPRISVQMRAYDYTYLLLPRLLVEDGEDFDIACYRVMPRESQANA